MAWNNSQIAEYNAYRQFILTPEGQGFPVPQSIDDYFSHRDEWMGEQGGGTVPPSEWSVSQRSAYDRYQMYGDLYGDPEDWYPKDITDFFDNYNVASEQLDEWQTEAAREYQEYQDFSGYRVPGEFNVAGLDDFVKNYDRAQDQQSIWSLRYQDRQQEQQREASRTQVNYGRAFYEKVGEAKGESVYYQDWMRRIFPGLRSEFQATTNLPEFIGPEEKGKIEQSWKTWLEGADLYQRFYKQPPYARGERPYAFDPRMKQVSY